MGLPSFGTGDLTGERKPLTPCLSTGETPESKINCSQGHRILYIHKLSEERMETKCCNIKEAFPEMEHSCYLQERSSATKSPSLNPTFL